MADPNTCSSARRWSIATTPSSVAATRDDPGLDGGRSSGSAMSWIRSGTFRIRSRLRSCCAGSRFSRRLMSKSALQTLIASGPIERELQRALKADPSLLGEVYGHPVDEYICFARVSGCRRVRRFRRVHRPIEDGRRVDRSEGRRLLTVVNGDQNAGFERNINRAAEPTAHPASVMLLQQDLESCQVSVCTSIRKRVESGKGRGPEGARGADGYRRRGSADPEYPQLVRYARKRSGRRRTDRALVSWWLDRGTSGQAGR